MKINYLVLIFAFGLGYGSYYFALKTSKLINHGHKVEGKVVELSKGSMKNSKGHT
jgi:hypothetical protein